MPSLKSVVGFLVLITFSNLNAQTNIEILQKIDSLAIRIAELQNRQINNNQMNSNENVNLGSGLFINTLSAVTYNFAFELGYMWKTGSSPAIRFPSVFLGNRKDYRYGISLGGEYFDIELVKYNESFIEGNGYGFYTKIILATPVLLNYISINSYLKIMYAMPIESKEFNIYRERMVYGYGFDVEFWFTQYNNVTIGVTNESDAFFKDIDDSIYPTKIRFIFGFKTFF